MLDVAIGLAFFYVTLSLVCSAIQEIIAGVFGLRSRNLRRGIENLVRVRAGVVRAPADTIRIAEQLWRDDALRTAVAAAAEEAVAAGDLSRIDERAELDTFPIGYPDAFPAITARTIVGWLVTIAAISLGAPFWFDLLGKIVHLRASGRNRADGRGVT